MKNSIHIYYSKRRFIWYLLGCVALLLGCLWAVYYQACYPEVYFIGTDISLGKVYEPFIFPDSFEHVHCILLLSVPFLFFAVVRLVYMLVYMLPKPAFIITQEGIIQGNLPIVIWSDIANVSVQVLKKYKHAPWIQFDISPRTCYTRKFLGFSFSRYAMYIAASALPKGDFEKTYDQIMHIYWLHKRSK